MRFVAYDSYTALTCDRKTSAFFCPYLQGTIEVPEWSSESEDDFSTKSPSFPSQLKILLVFMMVWQCSFKISNAAISCLLCFLRYFIGKAFQSRE